MKKIINGSNAYIEIEDDAYRGYIRMVGNNYSYLSLKQLKGIVSFLTRLIKFLESKR